MIVNRPLTPSRSDPRCSRWTNSLVAMATQPALGERHAVRGEGGREKGDEEGEGGGDNSLALFGTTKYADKTKEKHKNILP